MNVNFSPISKFAEVNPKLPQEYRQQTKMPVSFVPMNAVSEDGYISSEEEKSLGDVSTGYTYFERGDVLLAKITPCLENGKAALADAIKHQVAFGTTEFHVLRPKNGTHPRYLFHAIWNPRFRFFAAHAMKGAAGQKRVPTDLFDRIEIPDVDINVQKRIAAILDRADAIRRKRQQAIQLADDFLRSVFLELFGNPATNPKGFETAAIKELGVVITGNTPSRAHPEYYGNEIEWIKSDNINTPSHFLTCASEALSKSGRSLARTVPAGSILVTCIAGSRDCIGNVALTDREVAFNQQINAIAPNDKINQWFLYSQILFSKTLFQRASTNSMKGMVSKSKFEEIKLLNPPSRMQEQFGTLCQLHIGSTQRLWDSRRHAEALFKSTAQRAFTGEL